MAFQWLRDGPLPTAHTWPMDRRDRQSCEINCEKEGCEDKEDKRQDIWGLFWARDRALRPWRPGMPPSPLPADRCGCGIAAFSQHLHCEFTGGAQTGSHLTFPGRSYGIWGYGRSTKGSELRVTGEQDCGSKPGCASVASSPAPLSLLASPHPPGRA